MRRLIMLQLKIQMALPVNIIQDVPQEVNTREDETVLEILNARFNAWHFQLQRLSDGKCSENPLPETLQSSCQSQ